ncbi:MAG: hypothetical protein CVV44_13200 [Spirochaetae bacterium HGW-Spirochaetae-1]|nr:MAG: hypothetical protein CVV44_13200 [Spirochaetae bacterium HGW-Spirochaetae-1]
MLYISLIFILSGLLLFAFSVISGSLKEERRAEYAGTPKQKESVVSSSKTNPAGYEPSINADKKREKKAADNDVEEPVKEVKELFLAKDKVIIDDNIPEVFSDGEDDSVFVGDPLTYDNGLQNGEAIAVLFDDHSSVVDYQHRKGVIDPGLTEYRNIKRIGRGRLLVEKEGINFKIDSKLFRFDFFKLDQFYSGDNYIALKIRGREEKKLFIFENGKEAVPGIKEGYEAFLSRV